MLRKYRNALFEMIRAVNMNPRDFKSKEEVLQNFQAFRLQVGDSSLNFVVRTAFSGDERVFDCKYSKYERAHPEPKFPETDYPSVWYKFSYVEKQFQQWLDSWVRKYLSDREEETEDLVLPDLWTELDLSESSFVDSQVIQNTLFSLEEQKRIAETVNEFEQEVQRREILSQEQADILHERIEYLVESSKRLGRKDWLAAAAGSLIGFTFQSGLTSENAMQIIHLAGEAIRWIAHTPLLLP